MSRPPMRLTIMSWLNTESPCGRRRAGLGELVEVRLGDELRLGGVGDVEDVDVELLHVVDEHDVDLAGVLVRPGERGVRLVGARLRDALGLRAVLLGEVAGALDELLRRVRVAHVDERDAADAVGRARAPLVLVDEQVALVRGRVHRDDLRALAGERVRVARDVALHLRAPPGWRCRRSARRRGRRWARRTSSGRRSCPWPRRRPRGRRRRACRRGRTCRRASGRTAAARTDSRPASEPAAPWEFQCTPTPELIQLSLVVPKSIGCAPAVPAAIANAPVAASAARARKRRFTCPLLCLCGAAPSRGPIPMCVPARPASRARGSRQVRAR